MDFHSNMPMSDSELYPCNRNLIVNVEENVGFLTRKLLNSNISLLLLISKKYASQFRRETANENQNFIGTKTWIYNSYLIKQSSQGYRCESGIAIFAWRVTWNYAYGPFKMNLPVCIGAGHFWNIILWMIGVWYSNTVLTNSSCYLNDIVSLYCRIQDNHPVDCRGVYLMILYLCIVGYRITIL